MPGAQEPAAGTGQKPGPHEGAGHTRARRHVGQRRGRLPISHFKGDGPLKTKTVTMFRGVCDVRNEMRSDRTTDAGGHRGGGSPATREKARRLRHTGPASDALCEPRGDLRGETPAAAEPRGKANHEKTLGAREGRENRAKNRRETQKSNSNADYSRGSATITVNVNGLNPPIKRQRLPDGVEKQDPTERCL